MPASTLGFAAVRRLIDLDPAQAGRFLQEFEAGRAAAVLGQLPAADVAAAMPHLHPVFAAAVLARLAPAAAGEVLRRVAPRAAADAFQAMGQAERLAVLEALPTERKRSLQDMLAYPQDSAGRLMSQDFTAFSKDSRVREAVEKLRQMAHNQPAPTYAYVVGPENTLVGVLNMRDLLLADPGASLESVMRRSVLAVSPFLEREELVRLTSEKRYLALPVVDAQRRLLGVVAGERLLDSARREAAQDLQILFGGGADEQVLSPVALKVSRRMPWLQANLATAFLAAGVVSLFEGLISKFAILAVFLPVVAGQGGNAGFQSLSVILRGLVMREILPQDAARVVGREMLAGLANGILTGLVAAAAAWLWKGDAMLGVVVALAMIVNLVAAGAAGAAIPLAMKRLGYDPAQSSGILLTTVTDVVGFFSFLGFASLFSSKLM
ncbi:MAG: magnesium transporter [Elusimicrobia bacterium]|nr:magnesium transporter [Elusimicrobiota bacterium]